MFSASNGAGTQVGVLVSETVTSLSKLKSCFCIRGKVCAKAHITCKQYRSLNSNWFSKSAHEIQGRCAQEWMPLLRQHHCGNWTVPLRIPSFQKLADLQAHVLSRSQRSHWNVSYVSANSFLENKLAMQKRYASQVSKKDVVVFQDGFGNHELGNSVTGRQCYRTTVNENPEFITRRFKSAKFAVNGEFNEQYLKALLLNDSWNVKEGQRKFIPAPDSGTSVGTNGLGGSGASGTDHHPVQVVIANQKGTFYREQFWSTVRFLVGLYLLHFVLEANLKTKTAACPKEILPEQSEQKVKFDDVKGVDEAKQELQELVEFLRSPKKFERLGGKLPTGLLLVGQPGVGKTLLARAIAGEANVPFFFTSGSEFNASFESAGAARVKSLFSAAKEHAPCIVFIDELDAIGGSRGANEHQPNSRMTLNQLLVGLDSFDQTEGVVVIGATNAPEVLDGALTRPGRFNSKVYVSMPDVKGRIEILNLYLKNIPISDDVNVQFLARLIRGFSGADIQDLVNQASIRAAVEDSDEVHMAHFEWAIEKITLGPEHKGSVIEQKDLEIIAYHESGHAIVALYTPEAVPIHKATIIPRGQALGMVTQLAERDLMLWSKRQLLAKLDVFMAGRVAEELIFGEDSITIGAASDLQQATVIARAMVTKCGMSDKVGTITVEEMHKISPEMQALIESEVKAMLKDAYMRAKSILTARSEEHRRLAEALLKYETLTADEVRLVVADQPLVNK